MNYKKYLNEEFTSKTDPKLLSEKIYRLVFSGKVENMIGYLDGKWGNDLQKLIKEINKIKGKPKFGDTNTKSLGSFIESLKNLEDKMLDFTTAFNEAQNEYGVNLFKDIKKR